MPAPNGLRSFEEWTDALVATTIDIEENRVRVHVRVLRRLRAPGAGDEGISLLEVVISLVILAVVMTAAAGFFINGLRTTGGQSSRQAAISLTNQELERVNALPPGSLLKNRTLTAVQALLATDTGKVLTGSDDTSNATSASLDYDAGAVPAAAVTVPTGAPASGCAAATDPNFNCVTEGKVVYQLRTFIDPCWLPTGTSTSTNTTRNLACAASSTPPAGSPGVSMEYRVTVATTWQGGASTNCAKGCSFNDSTLIDPHGDAIFNSNISQPTINTVSPASVGGNAAVTLTLTGNNFVYGAAITVTCDTCTATVGTVDQTTNTGTSIKVPMTFGPARGTATIRLTNPDGGTAVATFTVNPPPSVTSFSPATVLTGTATIVTFTGTNLSSTSVVTASAGTVTGTSYAGGALTFSYTGTTSIPNPVFTVTNADGGTTTVTGITVKPPVLSYINNDSPQISYNGFWGNQSNRNLGDYNNDVAVTSSPGSFATLAFTGVSVAFLTETYSDEGQIIVSVDGKPGVPVSTLSTVRYSQVPVFSVSGLTNGPHTITVTAAGGFLIVDAFQIGTVS